MSKKIGILTFHYANNHGAVLQAYALRETVNSFPGCQAELINYVPKGYRYPVLAGSSIEALGRMREKFNRFLAEHCGVCTPMLHSVTGNAYDLYLVGSDQVWNTDLLEVVTDYEYFLPHLDREARRIAYSASIGMKVENMDQTLFQKYLPAFHSISLREKSYQGIISRLAGKLCASTLDPSMLLDGGHYEALIERPDFAPESSRTEEPFLLYFWYDMGDGGLGGIGTVNTLARKYGLIVRHTFLSEHSAARQMLVRDGGCMFESGIGEFLWYIKNASVVVTNSFHGVVFSLLFQRPLYLFYPEIRSSRQENLVELFGLERRTVKGYISPDQLNLEMDYGPIFKILEQERERSLSYLKLQITDLGKLDENRR